MLGNWILPGIGPKRHAWLLSAERVYNQRWHFSTDRRTGRVFNNFTSLPKILRRYALLDGRPCAEIDIQNSQPFCLAALYPPGSIEGPGFAELVAAGKFYERINEANGSPFSDRDELKEAVYSQILFGRHFKSSPLWKGFTDLFPELARIIIARKSADYRRLAIDLQRKETALMIRRVVPRLAAELPGVPMLTVHDSLCIDIEYQEHAADVIIKCAEEMTGNVPSLRITAPACLPSPKTSIKLLPRCTHVPRLPH